MSIESITMPKWGMSMSEGKLAGWLVEEGATISPGMELLEIETDKITNVLEAQSEGVLRRRVAAAGDLLPVGALLGVMADSVVSDAEIDAYVAENRMEAGAEQVEGSLLSILQIEGQAINVMDSGGSDRAILLLHGFGGDLNNWLFNFDELSRHLRAVAIDLPGHGRSSKDVGDGSVSGMVDIVGKVMDTLGLREVHLVGHSMGGKIAAVLALTRTDVVASMTLLAPAGLANPVNGDFVSAFIAANDRKEMKRVLSLLFADPDAVTRDMVNDVLQYKRIDGVSEALARLAGNALKDDASAGALAGQVAELGKRATILWGAADNVIGAPAEADPALANLDVRIIRGKGHMLHMEAAKDVNAVILSQA